MTHPQTKVHRMFELVEPIATVTFSEVPNEAFLAIGMRNYWDGYFAGRAGPRRWGWHRPRWCTRTSTTVGLYLDPPGGAVMLSIDELGRAEAR